MSPEQILESLLEPVEWTPEIAAGRLRTRIAVRAAFDVRPDLYWRKPPTRLIRRTPRMVDEYPTQVWARYPDVDGIAFVITSLVSPGVWATAQNHRVDVYTAKLLFDPHDSDYLIDQYEGDGAFAYALGTPDFLQAVKRDGIEWVTD
jgi:hypothetical protein